MMTSTISRTKRIVKGLIAAAFWLCIWQLAATAVDLPLLLPGPVAVWEALTELAGEETFWAQVGLTLLRILGGFAMGAVAGFLVAVLTSFSSLGEMLLSPAIRIIRATPVASFILLCMLWLKSGFLPAFIAGLMVMPVVWGNVSEGFQQTDAQLLEMARVYGMSRIKTFFVLYLPSVIPYFRAACLTAMGMAWKSGVAAEVLCQPRKSVGTGLYFAKIYLETPNLFAWTAVVIVLSVVVEKLFAVAFRHLGSH